MGLWGSNIQEDFLKKWKKCQAKKSSLDQYVDSFAALGVTSLIYTGPDCPLDFLHLLNLTIVNLRLSVKQMLFHLLSIITNITTLPKFSSKEYFYSIFFLIAQYEKGFSNISYKNSFPYFIYVSFTWRVCVTLYICILQLFATYQLLLPIKSIFLI